MNIIYKEVDFNRYCSTCNHEGTDEKDKPCNECLENPVNEFSDKPVMWEEKE